MAVVVDQAWRSLVKCAASLATARISVARTDASARATWREGHHAARSLHRVIIAAHRTARPRTKTTAGSLAGATEQPPQIERSAVGRALEHAQARTNPPGSSYAQVCSAGPGSGEQPAAGDHRQLPCSARKAGVTMTPSVPSLASFASFSEATIQGLQSARDKPSSFKRAYLSPGIEGWTAIFWAVSTATAIVIASMATPPGPVTPPTGY